MVENENEFSSVNSYYKHNNGPTVGFPVIYPKSTLGTYGNNKKAKFNMHFVLNGIKNSEIRYDPYAKLREKNEANNKGRTNSMDDDWFSKK